MNWQKAAIDDLRCYIARRESVPNIKSRLRALAHEMTALKATSTDKLNVQGGDARVEDKWLNILVEREKLINNLRAVRRLVAITERGLEVLTPEERRVLELFYISPVERHIDALMDELCYEKTHVYRLKDRALKKFARAVYGLVED